MEARAFDGMKRWPHEHRLAAASIRPSLAAGTGRSLVASRSSRRTGNTRHATIVPALPASSDSTTRSGVTACPGITHQTSSASFAS